MQKICLQFSDRHPTPRKLAFLRRLPCEILDSRGLSSMHVSSSFSEGNYFPPERQMGFWKPETMPSHHGTLNSVDPERSTNPSMTSWKVIGRDLGSRSSLRGQPAFIHEEKNVNTSGVQYENSLFSSSLSEVFMKKLKASTGEVLFSHSVNTVTSHFENEQFESAEEIEAQTIGNLLPDDEDLFSGILDELEYIAQPNCGDDIDDFDLFSSGGGLELEADDGLSSYRRNTSLDFSEDASTGLQVGPDSIFAGEHPYGEHPSRTLFVRNINSNVEDSELTALFEQFGDIRKLYTACKHRGFVMISYYDIRAARSAMRALQNKPLRRRKLDIHFSIPKDNPSEKDINQGTMVVFNLDSSVSNDDLRKIFGAYGEIKEIRETPHKPHHRFIEFYDIRAAEVALRALNRSDIAGKQIKLEPGRPGGAKRLMQQLSPELELDEAGSSQQWGSLPSNSPSGCNESVPPGTITSNALDVGAIQYLHSAIRAPPSPSMENGFHGISSSVPFGLSPPGRVGSAGNLGYTSGLNEPNRSLGQMNFGLQSMPSFHRSLPEYHNGVSNIGISYNSPGTISAMAASMSSRLGERVDNQHMQRLGLGGLNRHSFELNEDVFGASGNRNHPIDGHHYIWGKSNSYHSPPSLGPMMWPNSPTIVDGVHAHPLHQLHGLPRAPSHMMNNVVPLPHHQHHVGSAPAVNPSLWDRRQGYVGNSTEASGFHAGSLGSLGFSSSSNLHSLELASCNIFSHASGNCIDPSISSPNVVRPSPQQMAHMFPGRNPMIPSMPNSYDGPTEHRVRSRRSEANSNLADNKKQYELDIDRIMRGEDTRTTLMIKNIPNKYTSKMLLAAIDEHHRGTYDFIYLPIDFKNKCNVGYAFINMINPIQIVPFYQAFNGKKWEKFNSEKVASLAYGRIQGKAALVAHFQNSSLMNEDKRCRPILFHSDGPNAGDQEPFPMGVNIRPRPAKTRISSNEGTHRRTPSTSANEDASSSGSSKDSD